MPLGRSPVAFGVRVWRPSYLLCKFVLGSPGVFDFCAGEGRKARVESTWKCSDISREDAGRVARLRGLLGVLIGHFKR